MSTVYILFARFDRLSFERHERFIRPAVERIKLFIEILDADILKIIFDHTVNRSEEHGLSSTAKVCCFLLAVVVIVPCTYRGVVVPVDSAEGKVFLNGDEPWEPGIHVQQVHGASL